VLVLSGDLGKGVHTGMVTTMGTGTSLDVSSGRALHAGCSPGWPVHSTGATAVRLAAHSEHSEQYRGRQTSTTSARFSGDAGSQELLLKARVRT